MTQRRVLKWGKKMQKGTRVRGKTQNPSTVTTQCAAQLSHIYCLRSTPWESNLERATEIRSQTGRQSGRSRCKHVDMGNIYVRHSSSRSSSWKRLFGEFTLNRKSATKNSKTIVLCDKKVGQRSGRNSMNIHDQLARKFFEKDDSVDWPDSSAFNSESLYFLRFIIVHGKGRRKSIGLSIHPNVENWIELMRSRWSSSGQFFQDSLLCRFSPRSRTWWLKCNVILSNSQDGSSSCQCTTTLYGEKNETKTCVLRISKS